MSTPISSAFPRTASWNATQFGAGVTVGSDILYPALRMIRMIRPGQGPQTEVVTEALAALNAMLDSWNTERLAIPAILRRLFTLTANDGEYTIGPSGDFQVSIRPTKIEQAGLVHSVASPTNPLETELEVYTLQRWQDIAFKSMTSALPAGLYYDRNLSVGNGTIYLWPIPTVANQVALYLWEQLTQFASITDAFQLPQGYLRALQYNLAVELAPRFEGAVLTEPVVKTANDSKASIKIANFSVRELRCDPGMLGKAGRQDIRLG